MILGNLEVLAEAYTVANKSGIESSSLLELVKGNLSVGGNTIADNFYLQIFSLHQCNLKCMYVSPGLTLILTAS